MSTTGSVRNIDLPMCFSQHPHVHNGPHLKNNYFTEISVKWFRAGSVRNIDLPSEEGTSEGVL